MTLSIVAVVVVGKEKWRRGGGGGFVRAQLLAGIYILEGKSWVGFVGVVFFFFFFLEELVRLPCLLFCHGESLVCRKVVRNAG